MIPYSDIALQNLLSNGLISDGTKPLPKPMLAYNQQGPVTITLWQFRKYNPANNW